MDTIEAGRYEDTNKLFENPGVADFHIGEWNEHNHDDVAKEILKKCLIGKPTVQMLGRWQPWHDRTPSTIQKMYCKTGSSSNSS